MDVFFYNTLTRTKEKFVSIEPGLVKIYTCGPTVYRDVHLGNFRTYIMADLIRRVLEYNGYKVKKVQNITDVGHMRRSEDNPQAFDPVIKAALESGQTPAVITQAYTQKFLSDAKRLNIIDADLYPKASDHIAGIIEIVKDLLAKGFAYDSGENIYFDVKKFSSYGRLSGNTLDKREKLLEAVRVASETDKMDSADFVLWKRVGPDYLMKWDSPWGLGSPGWHVECSVMSLKYLTQDFASSSSRLGGEYHRTIDIHTGGEDNIFPHHEDEIAQSEAWTGKKFVNYWLHGGHLLVEAEKMARRRSNVYLVEDLLKKGFNPLAFRYLTFQTYYRAKMNFTWEALAASEKALAKLYQVFASVAPALPTGRQVVGSGSGTLQKYEEKFLAAVNDDLDLPQSLSLVWDLVKSDEQLSAKRTSLLKFDQVLGLGFKNVKPAEVVVPHKVQELVRNREAARQRQDFSQADELRAEIEALGFVVEDTIQGPKVFSRI